LGLTLAAPILTLYWVKPAEVPEFIGGGRFFFEWISYTTITGFTVVSGTKLSSWHWTATVESMI